MNEKSRSVYIIRQKTAYELLGGVVGSEIGIRDRVGHSSVCLGCQNRGRDCNGKSGPTLRTGLEVHNESFLFGGGSSGSGVETVYLSLIHT